MFTDTSASASMEEVQVESNVLHRLKTIPFSEEMMELRRGVRKFCAFTHGKKIDLECYESIPAVTYWMLRLERQIQCYEFLGVHRSIIEPMRTILSRLRNPGALVRCSVYFEELRRLHELMKEVEPHVQNSIARMTCEESMRLDEAVACYHCDCYYASVIMAVSAIESRLHKLIEKTDKALYSSIFKRFTLGQIIELFDENKYKKPKYQKIKKILPEKHRPLVILLNQYRVFSVHPKNEVITALIAGSVLNLAFLLLMDSSLCPYSKRELACAERNAVGKRAKRHRRAPAKKSSVDA